MINLAGRKDCDDIINNELHRCRIDAVHGEKSSGEVPHTITGKLGAFTFRRAWYYWVVEGPMPVAKARELYADPCGREDIRVAGHAGCPEPEDPWLEYFAPDGKRVIPTKERTEFERFANSPTDTLRAVAERGIAEFHFEDDRTKYPAFVMQYHVDSELGLRLLADAIRSLDEQERKANG